MSERVLHEWRFAGYVCRIVETEPGIVHFEQAQGPPIGQEATGPLAFNRTEKPIGCANEIIHLSQALAEERLVADTRIRAMHMRIDNDEPIVRLATGLTFHPPGSLAHSQHLLELAALVEERRRHQVYRDARAGVDK